MKEKYILENVNLTFGSKKILNDINLKIMKGSNYCIIGPNGSGKTSLLNILTQHLSSYSGKVIYMDRDLKTYNKKQLSKTLGYVAQFESMAFDFNVWNFVMMGRNPHKSFFERENSEDIEIVLNALDSVKIRHLAERSINSLSGGEKQRAILARALAQTPSIMILDEPSNHLDITNQIRLLKILLDLNITTVTAMHDLNLAIQFFKEIIVLKDQKIYDYGEVKDVISKKMIKDVYELDSEIVYNAKTRSYSIVYYT